MFFPLHFLTCVAIPVVVPDNGADQLAVAPNTFQISFTVTPTVPSTDITWLFGNTEIIDGANPFLSLSEDRLTLMIRPVTSSSEGVYLLRATNSDGVGEGSVALSVESKLSATFHTIRVYIHYIITAISFIDCEIFL